MHDFHADPVLRELIETAPPSIDLTDRADLDQVTTTAERLLAHYPALHTLYALGVHMAERRDVMPVALRLASKLAKSKRIVSALEAPVHVSVVFAVYNEHHRILSRAAHAHGEDFLVRKVEQLAWLFGNREGFTWELLVVDDGCPNGSGALAERIAAKHEWQDRVRVLYLADAIEQGLGVAAGLTSTADSRKGGSILYGMWKAAQVEHERHVVVYTDADLSTHLGQTGLLVGPILSQDKAAAIGSRRRLTSVVIKRGMRNRRGKLFIYLWKRLIPVLGPIIDTQCGFKAVRADVVRQVVELVEEKGFAFDIELLARIAVRHEDGIEIVPIGWIDSEAESTTTDLQPYLDMIQSIAELYRKHLPRDPRADAFADFILSLDDAGWDALVDAVPDAIANREPAELTAYDGVSAADLAACIGRGVG
ncbi:MAG: hypothetical protein QNJ98_06710 [Planctomycetota bacterium]|nr:hypothetical protein [Planctomycetota bacterium]